jgi:hypothetical protein
MCASPSKLDITGDKRHVRFGVISRHLQRTSRCRLCLRKRMLKATSDLPSKGKNRPKLQPPGSCSNYIRCKIPKYKAIAAALMTGGYDISLATPIDIPGILALQEPNLPDSGGSLSVRQSADWFRKAIIEKSAPLHLRLHCHCLKRLDAGDTLYSGMLNMAHAHTALSRIRPFALTLSGGTTGFPRLSHGRRTTEPPSSLVYCRGQPRMAPCG